MIIDCYICYICYVTDEQLQMLLTVIDVMEPYMIADVIGSYKVYNLLLAVML